MAQAVDFFNNQDAEAMDRSFIRQIAVVSDTAPASGLPWVALFLQVSTVGAKEPTTNRGRFRFQVFHTDGSSGSVGSTTNPFKNATPSANGTSWFRFDPNPRTADPAQLVFTPSRTPSASLAVSATQRWTTNPNVSIDFVRFIWAND